MLTSGKVWGDFRREAKVKLGKERGSITWALRGQAVKERREADLV